MFFKTIYCLILFLINISLRLTPCTAENIKPDHIKPGYIKSDQAKTGQELKMLYEPEQITSESNPVLYMSVSSDSQKIVYSSGAEGNTDLWLKSLDSSQINSPVRLTDNPLDEISPVFSPDNRFIAYVGTSYDVKGDIFLLDLENKNAKPLRLTGKETEDGAPCFSSKGDLLYFHQTGKGSFQRHIVSLDLNDKNYRVKVVNANGDSAFPAVSPDGSKIAFVSYRDDPSGDIYIMDAVGADKDSNIIRLTQKPYMDFMPAWSGDGTHLYFSSIRTDTDKNGKIDSKDNSSIYKITIDKTVQVSEPLAFPITSSNYSALSPCISSSKLFFLSEKGGKTNCLALPAEGEIPACKNSADQISLSESIAATIPFDPYLTILAWYRVLEIFINDSYAGAKAGYEIGRIYQDMEDMDNAFHAFDIVTRTYKGVQPYAAFSFIQKTVISTEVQLDAAVSPDDRQKILAQGLARIKQLSEIKTESPALPNKQANNIKASAMMMYAKLLHERGRDSGSINKAMNTLEDIIKIKPLDQELIAETMLLKADILNQAGFVQKVYPAYMQVLKNYPQGNKWTDRAVEQIITISISGLNISISEDENNAEKIKTLRRIIEENREKYPVLAMGALNRIGDLYYGSNEWALAKSAYRQVLESFSFGSIQKAKAGFSLAEILYKQEHFRQALDLYESELYESGIGKEVNDDNLYRLARKAYIKKSIGAGEFLYRVKEIYSAQNRFKELIKYDYSIIEAHRGYIKCAAALRQIDNVLSDYNTRLKQNPDDPIAIYSAALCLTYYEDRQSLEKAEKLLLQAIEIDKQKEYFYQTLGYVLENLETVHGKTGNLNSALESYKTAWFLNDHQNNPDNAANLLLNMGNACFLLGRFEKALDYYNQRMESAKPFENEDMEIMFYRHLGASAFQARGSEKAIKAFKKTLDLIDLRVNPLAASDAFDLINRYITDRIISPVLKTDLKPNYKSGFKSGIKQKSLIEQAKALAMNQSDIYRQLTALTRSVSPAMNLKLGFELSFKSDSQWTSYCRKIKNLIKKQKNVFNQVFLLHEKNETSGLHIDEVRQTLTALASRVEDSLKFPERLIQLKAEILDRLGLAYQEDEKWEYAVNCFEKVFNLNKELGLDKNLALNKRSAAYNKYRMAETLSGRVKKDMLETAAKDFSHVIGMVNLNGVPDRDKLRKKQQKKTGLLDLSLRKSLSQDNKTAAAFGFTADQEIRLAKAFIARINTELGELIPAETAINEQLAQYPSDKPVAKEDIYGVSLLYHRAAHLSFARDKTEAAFKQFHYSAQLCLDMENPVSAGLNVSNMAHVLLKISPDNPYYSNYKTQVENLDARAGSLLLKSADTAGAFAAARYHNKMGVYYSNSEKGSTQKAANYRLLQKAGIHFARGIDLLEKKEEQDDKDSLNLLSIIHLNMAYTALNFGESESAKEHFKTALKYSKHGKFPDLQWRAYAGLDLMDEALDCLEKVTLFRAGCKKGEILNIFAAKVLELFDSGKIEDAFNLAERLSELERFNVLAQFTGLTEPESLYRSLYPNLRQIISLRKKISSAKGEEKHYLNTRLDQELLLLQSKTGKDLENLPEVLKLLPRDRRLEQVLMLLSTGAAAESAAKNFNPEYDALIEKYHKIRKQAIRSRPGNKPSDIFTFFGPEPYEAIDIMENILPGKTMIRLLKVQNRYIVFYLSSDDFKAEIIDSFDKIIFSKHDSPEKYYMVYENPEELPDYLSKSCALNSSHFMRSFMNRKPFKRSLLSLENLDKSIEDYNAYNIVKNLSDFSDKEIIQKIQGIHTLVLPGKVSQAASIPVRAGTIPEKFISLETVKGRQIRIERLFAQASGLSLAIMQKAKKQDAYIIGHMTSLYGCPSLLISDSQSAISIERQTNNNEFLKAFLKSYPDTTAFNALKNSEDRFPDTENRILLGFKGMNREASQAFASENFVKYIKDGQAAYKQGDTVYALTMFENAILIASEINEFQQYLTKLYEYGREAAFKTGDYRKSLEYAKKSLDLIADQQPDSEYHAESILRLGLIHARMENYEKAMPLLEEAVEIMTALELGPRLISALEESGIVLENATEYEQAMLRFKSAASLSETLLKDNLLAQQYAHMGRIYDMRLSRYALALQSYQKALEIYRDMEEIANIAQSLLNIGRCYRLLGNFIEADKYYGEASSTIEPLKSSQPDMFPEASAKIIIEQANNAWYQARYQDAFTLQQKAYAISKEHNLPLLEIITLNTAGLIWWTLGDQEKALFELNKALEKAQKFNKRKDEIATCLNNLGLVYREIGQYEKAMEKFDSALAIDKKIKSRWAIAYDLRNKAITLLRTNRAKKALPLFQKAAQEAREIGNRINEAKSLLGLGQANAALGNKADAKTALNKAFELSKSMYIRETWWRALFELSKLEINENKNDAKELLYQAMNVIEAMRAEIKIEQLRDSFITNKLEVYETLASLLADMGQISESFEVAERSRARNFIDILGNRQLQLNNQIEQELFEKQAKIRARIEEQESLLADSASTAVEANKQSRLGIIESLKNDLKNVMLEIQTKNPQMASLVSVEPLKTSDLYRVMEPGLVLISYYVLPRELFCWRISSQDIKLFRTPIDINSFSRDILDFRTRIQNLEPLADQAEKLSNIILKPIMSEPKNFKILGIIPHKILHYLSFATLAYENDYLIDHTPIFYLPSASILDITLSRRLNRKNTKVLAIGNPDLGDPAFDLPFSEHEVGSIQWNFPDIITRTRKDASEAWLSENIDKFGIIHLASHGEFDPINPLFSAIRLAKKEKADGNLEAREVFGLKINADMVVLSACQTGLGKITAGDDVIGLNRSFLYAGTHTTISSLWRVSDISSAILLKQFYRQYTKYNKAQSLRKAALHVKKQYPHPGYWGAFTLVGDFQ